jgi:hypothetical protein
MATTPTVAEPRFEMTRGVTTSLSELNYYLTEADLGTPHELIMRTNGEGDNLMHLFTYSIEGWPTFIKLAQKLLSPVEFVEALLTPNEKKLKTDLSAPLELILRKPNFTACLDAEFFNDFKAKAGEGGMKALDSLIERFYATHSDPQRRDSYELGSNFARAIRAIYPLQETPHESARAAFGRMTAPKTGSGPAVQHSGKLEQ